MVYSINKWGWHQNGRKHQMWGQPQMWIWPQCEYKLKYEDDLKYDEDQTKPCQIYKSKPTTKN